MGVTTPVALTDAGMLQLREELLTLRERRDSLAEVLAASPLDAGGSVLTEIALADRRIVEIEDVLSRAKSLDQIVRVPGVVGIGSQVTVRWDEDGDEIYTIVDPAEIAPSEGRISDESPVGQALMGKRVGDRVAVETMGGSTWLAIVAID